MSIEGMHRNWKPSIESYPPRAPNDFDRFKRMLLQQIRNRRLCAEEAMRAFRKRLASAEGKRGAVFFGLVRWEASLRSDSDKLSLLLSLASEKEEIQ